MVAGGGGGAYSAGATHGGAAGQVGSNGQHSGTFGGFGATQSAGGASGCEAGNTVCGTAGSLAQGGASSTSYGGGGGGGYYGGGGGRTAGGGGSSYIISIGTATSITSGVSAEDGSLTVRFQFTKFNTITSSLESFTIPWGANSMIIDMYGARGGSFNGVTGGFGARVRGSSLVSPGTKYFYTVGGRAEDALGSIGGYNGGGNGGALGTGGGGGTDLRYSSAVVSRIAVAGGGGGISFKDVSNGGAGGQTGVSGTGVASYVGTGATQTAVGVYGCNGDYSACGTDGSVVVGGNGEASQGGGGGGGYYGGGGGRLGGGGGSSAIATSFYGVTYTTGAGNGDGSLAVHFLSAAFELTNSMQTFIVPLGADSMTVNMCGASGGSFSTAIGGKGACVQATFAVTQGTIYYYAVGGKAADAMRSNGGYNGGGNGATGTGGCGGGGATDLRTGTALTDRIMVAGGGGGGEPGSVYNGGNSGQVGSAGTGAGAGLGATQTAGGGVTNNGGTGTVGTLGQGGNGMSSYGGGGGGGYYGGGGGAYAGGGGGSSYVSPAGTEISYSTSSLSGDGFISISFVNMIDPTSQPSSHPSRQPSSQPSTQPSRQPSVQPSTQPKCKPSNQPTCQPQSSPSSHPSSQPSGQPSEQPGAIPSYKPTQQPTCTPTMEPSEQPYSLPSDLPTSQPSICPSAQPLGRPTSMPTVQPSTRSSCQPTALPSTMPTRQPSSRPSLQPTTYPSVRPSVQPFGWPSVQPSCEPSQSPSTRPSVDPSVQPIAYPTSQPSLKPSGQPTSIPSSQPSLYPSLQPSSNPSHQPSGFPSKCPSNTPSSQPSILPSLQPSSSPSLQPKGVPSLRPSNQPSGSPSGQPWTWPTNQPTCNPFAQPTTSPSVQPSSFPSYQPANVPSTVPSIQPTNCPTVQPSVMPTTQPFRFPSSNPTLEPSGNPSSCPSCVPSIQPSNTPSNSPSCCPTSQPITSPTCTPSKNPSSQPSITPTTQPSTIPSIQPSSRPSFTWGNINVSTNSTMASLPSKKPMSVLFVGGSRVEVNNFKIVLPFRYTSFVSGDQYFDVVIPASVSGTNYFLSGTAAKDKKTLHTSGLMPLLPSIAYDFTGRSVSNAGDVNGDGYDDLVIGVPFASKVYVLYGNSRGFVDMSEGFTIFGAEPSDLTGWSVSAAGDVNNDTIADIIISAPNANDAAGEVYVLYGSLNRRTNVNLQSFDSSEGFSIVGANHQDCLGVAVSSAGDINGDGVNDIVVGALRVNDLTSGAVFVIYGQLTSQSLHLSTLTVSRGIAITGAPFAWLGSSVSGAGDVNNDGYADVLIGSVPRRTSRDVEISYILFGDSSLASGSVAALTAGRGVVIYGGGSVVAGLGDVDNDGFDDVMICSGYDFSSGGGFVISLPHNLTITAPSISPTVRPTHVATHRPSIAPSLRPSALPSAVPSLTPTQPTEIPTTSPTGPTFAPSVTPTQPSSRPSSTPTSPSMTPSIIPTEHPTCFPSPFPTVNPTTQPSTTPTESPSVVITTIPSTSEPSFKPTLLPSILPSRFPVVRPTAMPVISTPENITYITTFIVSGGVYARNTSNLHFIVNTTEDTVIGGTGGTMRVTVIANAQTVLQINQFNRSTDVVDFTDFRTISAYRQLNMSASPLNLRRVLHASSEVGSVVTIHLPLNQKVILHNMTVSQLSESNFVFAKVHEVPAIGRMQKSWGPVIVISVLSGTVLVSLLYEFRLHRLATWSDMIRKKVAIDWEKEEDSNPTFVKFNPEQSDQSMTSTDYSDVSPPNTDSSYSSDDSSDISNETKSQFSDSYIASLSVRSNHSNISEQSQDEMNDSHSTNSIRDESIESAILLVNTEHSVSVSSDEVLSDWSVDSAFVEGLSINGDIQSEKFE